MPLHAIAAAALLAVMPSPASALNFDTVSFTGGDGTRLSALYARPSWPTPVAAVVILHGCGGLWSGTGDLKAREAAWAEILHDEGYAVLLVDSFGSRNLGSLCRVRDRPVKPDRERPRDAYAALQWLQGKSEIRHDRVALAGWSNGAMTMLWTAWRDTPARPAGLRHDFVAAVGFYPGCDTLRRQIPDYRVAMPTLLQLGAEDNWTLPNPCLDLAREAMARGGAEIIADVHAGAVHGFDHPGSMPREVTTRNSAYASGEKRVNVGTHELARDAAISRTKAFLARFLRN